MEPTIIFCGGGSGGHLYPGLAVAEEIRNLIPEAKFLFVGSERALERRILERAGVEHLGQDSLPASTLFRHPLRFLKIHRRLVRTSRELLRDRQAVVVVGLGGFASIPMATAAARAAVPLVLLEQNRVVGRATHFLSRRAALICTSFPGTRLRSRRATVLCTGNPVRQCVRSIDVEGGSRTMLILGGSQGAVRLNELVMGALNAESSLPDQWRVVHQSGPAGESRVREHYDRARIDADVYPFIDDMPAQYASSALAVTRAGGTTLAELACIGVPALLVPFPRAVRNHQKRNAEYFAERGAAELTEHDRCDAASFRTKLRAMCDDADRRVAMSRSMKSLARPQAATEIARAILALANRAIPAQKDF